MPNNLLGHVCNNCGKLWDLHRGGTFQCPPWGEWSGSEPVFVDGDVRGADKRRQLSTTFTKAEVRALMFVATALQRGGDPRVVARSEPWRALVRKFQKLDQKSKGDTAVTA